MQITEVRIMIVRHPPEASPGARRLLANFSLVFDQCLAVHGVKLIDSDNGRFIAMPSELAKDRCPQCKGKNPLNHSYCCRCGEPLASLSVRREELARRSSLDKLHWQIDVTHPLNNTLRTHIQEACEQAYERELSCAGTAPPLRLGYMELGAG